MYFYSDGMDIAVGFLLSDGSNACRGGGLVENYVYILIYC